MMSPKRKSELVESIQADWMHQPAIAQLCLDILAFVSADSARTHLTVDLIGKGVGKSGGPDLASAIQYLLGDSSHVLELVFEVIDDEGYPRQISLDEAVAAHERKINPLTGDIDPGIEHQILTFFRPAKALYLE